VAIDTLERRASTIAVSFYAMSPSVQADGAIDLEDRRLAGYGYSGIAVAASTVEPPDQIVDLFDVQWPDIHPVRVEEFDVLKFAWG